jgi:CRISPR/Cas system-associated endonuclease Cas1
VNGQSRSIDAHEDEVKRFYISKKMVEAMTQRSFDVMKWLAVRYGGFSAIEADLSNESERLNERKSMPHLLMLQGRIADIYWRYLHRVLPAKRGFASRMHETHQRLRSRESPS